MLEILQLLLAFKSDPNQRGINDYTPLHMAVSEHDLRAVDLLLQADAAPCLERWRRRRAFAKLQKCSRCGRRDWDRESTRLLSPA